MKCDICGRNKAEYIVEVKNIETNSTTNTRVCASCLHEMKEQANKKSINMHEDFDKKFEETFGNPYLGSDFI